MISILENGSLTCIGKNRDNKIDVVWFFYGIEAINILNKFSISQTFQPRLHLKVKSYNEFTNTINDSIFRFDVGKSSKECERLLHRKLEFIKNGIKKSLMFLNEDDTQIPCICHRVEQKSFAMTRTACNSINIKVERKHEYAYGHVDFIVNEYVRVQDKIGSTNFSIRGYGKLPYNPDEIDIFQVSDIVNNVVYTIPMRIIKDNIIISYFNSKELMKNSIAFCNKWKEDHKQYKYDFKTSEEILLYVKACENASIIPKLTDINFYKNMIEENKDKFGSRKQLESSKNKD